MNTAVGKATSSEGCRVKLEPKPNLIIKIVLMVRISQGHETLILRTSKTWLSFHFVIEWLAYLANKHSTAANFKTTYFPFASGTDLFREYIDAFTIAA